MIFIFLWKLFKCLWVNYNKEKLITKELNQLTPSNYLVTAYKNISHEEWWYIVNSRNSNFILPTLNKNGGLTLEDCINVVNNTPDFEYRHKVIESINTPEYSIHLVRGFFQTFHKPFIELVDMSKPDRPKIITTINNSIDHMSKEMYKKNFTSEWKLYLYKKDNKGNNANSALHGGVRGDIGASSANPQGSSLSKVNYSTNFRHNILGSNIDTINLNDLMLLRLPIACWMLVIFCIAYWFIISFLSIGKVSITPRLYFFKRCFTKLWETLNTYLKFLYLRFVPKYKPKWP